MCVCVCMCVCMCMCVCLSDLNLLLQVSRAIRYTIRIRVFFRTRNIFHGDPRSSVEIESTSR